MKAVVYSRYGSPDVLQVAEVQKPVPKDNEVLLAVRAASVNPLDWHFMRGEPYFMRVMTGLREPKSPQLGVDVAGVVEAIGAKVSEFKTGDDVFGAGRGTFAEYACAPDSTVVTKLPTITFEQAAAVNVAGLTALQSLRDKGQVQPGQKVLINGAAGGVGTFAVQIAKWLSTEVTGVCSTRNLEMVRSIGADHVIDYTREDFTRSGRRYDVIVDCFSTHSLTDYQRVLNPRGRCVLVGGPMGRWFNPLPDLLKTVLLSIFGDQKFVIILAKSSKEDLAILRDLIAAGKVTPVIDRRYPLDVAAEAVRYVETGHARGKVVVTVEV